MAFAAIFHIHDASQQAHRQIERAASIVANQIEWRTRATVAIAHRMKCTCNGDIVEVMSRSMRQRAGLSPSRHAPVNQLRIAGERDIRPETVALHDAGSETLDQPISFLDQLQRSFDISRIFQVESDGPAPPAHHISCAARATITLPINPNHICAKIRQQHAAKGSRSNTCELYNPNAIQRSLSHDISYLLFWSHRVDLADH